jgi:hypothetical protein
MTMLLRWRMPGPPIKTVWRGDDGTVAAQLAADPETPIAAIIGPAGPPGTAFDLASAVIDAGTFN